MQYIGFGLEYLGSDRWSSKHYKLLLDSAVEGYERHIAAESLMKCKEYLEATFWEQQGVRPMTRSRYLPDAHFVAELPKAFQKAIR
jgi:hypothetical protein